MAIIESWFKTKDNWEDIIKKKLCEAILLKMKKY
jgi:hypothetical protein